ncbi:MAG TPA: Hsp20/alpha crystallin family protein [Syntrophomonadaceae bacterium]|nr:Hsp20/alpha crystallin family protein [Syntrophomonadaceae bacterium]
MFDLIPFRRRNSNPDNFWNRDLMADFFNNGFPFDLGMDIRADIRENENEYVVEAELPGVKKDDVVVELRDNTLSISAQMSYENNEESSKYIRKERRQGTISRSFYVDNVDSKGVKADYKDGILKIVLPKIKPTSSDNYRIEIK